MKNRPKKCAAAMFALAFVLSASSASAFNITVSENSWVNSLATTTAQGNAGLSTFSRTSDGVYYKTYLKLDASSLTGQNITDLTSLLMTPSVNGFANSQGNTVSVYYLSSVDSSTWSDTTITWANAPGNNTGGAGFTAGAGADLLTSATGFTVGTESTFAIGSSSAETSLIGALNTGSRIATLGLIIGTSPVDPALINFHSNQASTAAFQPSFTGTAVPEPSAYAAIAGLIALSMVTLRRRRG